MNWPKVSVWVWSTTVTEYTTLPYITLDNSDIHKKESDKAADLLKHAIFMPQPQTMLTAYPRTFFSREGSLCGVLYRFISKNKSSTEKQTVHARLAESGKNKGRLSIYQKLMLGYFF